MARRLAASLALALAAGQNTPWPMFGATSGNMRATGSEAAGIGESFGLLWSFATGGKVVGSAAMLGGANLSSPALAFIGSEVCARRRCGAVRRVLCSRALLLLFAPLCRPPRRHKTTTTPPTP